MAEVHVLTINGTKATLVLHIPMITGNNLAGILNQTAFINAGLVKTSVLKSGDGTAGTISSAEAAELAAATKFERIITYELASDFDSLTGAQKNATVDQIYNAAKPDQQALLTAQLKYAGYTRVVP